MRAEPAVGGDHGVVLARAPARGLIEADGAGADLVRCGLEIVGLTERFYRGIFRGMLGFVGLAAVTALALLPLRSGAGGPPIPGVVGGLVLVLAVPVAFWRYECVYRALCGHASVQLLVTLYAAALVTVVLPLRSQLWWPSCALLMLLGIAASARRALSACLVVLALNLAAHLLDGDLASTPAVSIIGLWVGYIFWVLMAALMSDQLARYLMRLNCPRPAAPPAPRRVVSWRRREPAQEATEGDRSGFGLADPVDCVTVEDESSPAPLTPDGAPPERNPSVPGTPSPGAARGRTSPAIVDLPATLTARQLQVIALLADGMRYREIAGRLGISEGQVQRHVAGAVARAGAKNAVALVTAAVRERIVPAAGQTPPGVSSSSSDAGLHASAQA